MVTLFRSLAFSALVRAAFGGHYDYYDICPSGISTVTVGPEVDVYPVHVSQYFDIDTLIIINGGITIDVTNAPVMVDTVTTATVTRTVTTTQTATESASTTPAPPFNFAIEIRPVGLAKRQAAPDCNSTGQFINTQGFEVPSRSDAALYTLLGGELFNEGTPFSTNEDLATAPFRAISPPGSITETFAYSIFDSQLTWTNPLFSGGRARFFRRNSDRLLTVNFLATPPEDSEEVLLFAVDPFAPDNCQTSSTAANTSSTAASSIDLASVSSITSTDSASASATSSSAVNGTSSISSSATISGNITASATSSTESSSATADSCSPPQESCEGVEVNENTVTLGQSFSDLTTGTQSLDNEVAAIRNQTDAENLVDDVEALTAQFNSATSQFSSFQPQNEGCATDALVFQNAELLSSLSDLAQAFVSQADTLNSFSNTTNGTSLGLALDDLNDSFETFEQTAAGILPSRECFIETLVNPVQDDFDAANDAI